jgi:hypothetical protein
MINWPEMLRHAEDWANGFWTGAATVSAIGIVAATAVLISGAF